MDTLLGANPSGLAQPKLGIPGIACIQQLQAFEKLSLRVLDILPQCILMAFVGSMRERVIVEDGNSTRYNNLHVQSILH